jgi:hypothetical protein
VQSYGDPRLYAVALVAEHLSRSSQPLVPQQMFVAGESGSSNGNHSGGGALALLMNLLVAEKLGFDPKAKGENGKPALAAADR